MNFKKKNFFSIVISQKKVIVKGGKYELLRIKLGENKAKKIEVGC